ncbi:hypothetical protein VTL71DRAFT_2918 [Oculimacula yallundae]|uniref:NADPH-dependent diflavin oxidoreductase 1 n=1 Tax=Oculimacula yallundae TaxID=86028 RepID=A0ABR4C5Q4_9HELO
MSQTTNGQPHDRYALILYGSETGNSQDVAERLGQITERLHFKTIVTEMDDFAEVVEKKMKSGEVKKIPVLKVDVLRKATLLVLVTSTTGQGEFPKNSRKLWTSCLRKNLSPKSLEGLHFTTFGLGDSSYPKFNRAARLLHVRLQGLGANEVFPRGEADDQHQDGFDGAYLPWATEFQSQLMSSFPLPEGVEPIPPDVLLPFKWTHQIAEPYPVPKEIKEPNTESSTQTPLNPETEPNMIYIPPDDGEETVDCPQLKEEFPSDHLNVDPVLSRHIPVPDIDGGLIAELVENRRITPKSHWQDVRELTFNVVGEHEYTPGDTLTIYPQNFPEDVQALIDLMDWNEVADTPLKFQVEGAAAFFDKFLLPPNPKGLETVPRCTLRDLLTVNLDITAIPQRKVLDIFAHFTNDPTHKERLLEFSNPTFTDEFFDYATRPRRSILEVLQDFRSVKIPFNIVTSVFPIIRGREYSISSGGIHKTADNEYDTRIQLLVAVVNYKTVLSKVRRGLCTRFLAALPPKADLMVRINCESKFYSDFDEMNNRPVILVAPGTGLAPCRSLIWERRDLAYKDSLLGVTLLFFGGRNRDADYFYKEDWEDADLKVLAYPAFSRDDPSGRKVYVQDKIREKADMVCRAIKKNAIIFVCGSSGNMPKAVREAFVDAVETGFGFSREVAENFIKSLEANDRYRQETW